jgi:hypothetical protein
MVYLNTDLTPTNTGLTDIEYLFFNVYNVPIGDWLDTGVSEEVDNPGVYGALLDVPDNAYTIRWRSAGDHSIRYREILSGPRNVINPKGVINLTEDDFKMRWDSRSVLNGNTTIEVFSLGSDNLWAKDSITVNVSNNLNNNISHKEYFAELARDGYEFVKPHFGIESYELNDNPLRRGWLQVGVRTEGSALPADASDEQIESWWKQFRIIPLERGVSWKKTPTDSGYILERTNNIREAIKTQFHNNSTLERYSKQIAYGIKITPVEAINGYILGAEKVNKLRQYEDNNYFIFTTNPGKLLQYDGASLTLIADLRNYEYNGEDFGGSIDATYFEDKIYVVTSDHKLGVIDTTEGEESYLVIPLGESKPLQWVERTSEGIIAIYGDNDKTTAYTVNDLKIVWELDVKVDYIHLYKTILSLVVSGNTLYTSTDYGLIEPTVEQFSEGQENFPANIVSIYAPIVLLEDGKAYEKSATSNIWTMIVDLDRTGVSSVSYARIGESYLRPFFGQDGRTIIEMFADGFISDTRQIELNGIPNEDFNKISYLWHYEKQTVAAVGVPGSSAFVPPVYDDRLLIAVDGPDGESKAMLVILEKSVLNESGGAQLVSKISNPDIYPEEIRKI